MYRQGGRVSGITCTFSIPLFSDIDLMMRCTQASFSFGISGRTMSRLIRVLFIKNNLLLAGANSFFVYSSSPTFVILADTKNAPFVTICVFGGRFFKNVTSVKPISEVPLITCTLSNFNSAFLGCSLV